MRKRPNPPKIHHSNKTIYAIMIVLVAAAGLIVGWREFWFLTDDAFIAFRYVSNGINGHGYVWNPGPFRSVEGYTSFLYLIILEAVWRIFGKQPPASANFISLIFTIGSFVVTAVAVMKMKLNPSVERIRLLLLTAVLIGLLTNTSVLTWSSSGLETAMFNFFFLSWILAVILIGPKNNFWNLIVASLASLVYLSRPDGILIVAATLALIAAVFISELRTSGLRFSSLLSTLPLFVVPLHLVWRKSFYGEWLPNTYYAKFTGAWPEAGMRYLLSFIIEYGAWLWLILLCLAVVASFRSMKFKINSKAVVRNVVGFFFRKPSKKLCTIVAVSCLVAHVGFYTFVIGGDHFEWRVYSHLPPLILLSSIYFLNVLNLSPIRLALVLALVVLISLPMPWAYHIAEKQITKLDEKETLYITVKDKLPFFMRPLTTLQDNLQSWLTDHLICVRWREHQLFHKYMEEYFPPRSFAVPPYAGKYPLTAVTTVGVAGWVLPNVAIIDSYGLNDYIIARYTGKISTNRNMAHERTPPDNYLNSYMPNVIVAKGKAAVFFPRPAQYELTDERISELDRYWEAKIIRGQTIPDSLAPFPQVFQ